MCLISTSHPTYAQYYPLKLVNNTGLTNDSIFPYLILTAQDTTAANHQCVLQLNYSSAAHAQVATLVQIGPDKKSWNYTYRMDSLKGYDPLTKSVTILIPNLISGRCMVSLNYKLIMPVVSSDSLNTEWVFQDPNVNNTSDLNYNVLFDKFEFTYDKSNNFYIDPTAVDFFSIPISLRVGHKGNRQSSGPSPNAKRGKLMQAITSVLDSAGGVWDSLVIMDSSTLMRVTAPYLAPSFNANYLSQSGYNFIDSLVKYYASNIVRINCSELDVPGDEIFDKYGVSPVQDSNAYIFTSQPIINGQWIFTNHPLTTTGAPITDTIDMSIAQSNNFFGPGTAPFITPNKTVISILVKNITAAFTVGLLPAPDSMMLDAHYLNNVKKHPYYKKNKLLNAPSGSGPWYNLYTRALHKAIPEIYAFAFDDVLGQSGTLVSNNPLDTITVTLGDMGNITIPYHSNLMAVLSDSLTYNSGFIHVGSNYIDTLKWRVPAGQPDSAKYFFMGSGPDFIISEQRFLSYQYGNFFTASDTIGWVVIPDSLLAGDCINLNIPMAIYSCGGPDNPCPTNDSNWASWTNAMPSNLLPLLDSVVNPAAIDTFYSLTPSGNNYTATITWTVPAQQPSNAKYFFVASGVGFKGPVDSMIAWQVNNGFYSATDTTGVLTLSAGLVYTNKLDSVDVAIFTCGGPGHPCPTKDNLSYWQCDEGSTPQPQTQATGNLRSKKKKKAKR